MRSTIWWDDILHERIIPGTGGWDMAISELYYFHSHPCSITWRGEGRGRIAETYWDFDDRLADREAIYKVVMRDWYLKDDSSDLRQHIYDDKHYEVPIYITATKSIPGALVEIEPPKDPKDLYKGPLRN
jgi:hypothetical protein